MYTCDVSQTPQVHPLLREGDMLLGDMRLPGGRIWPCFYRRICTPFCRFIIAGSSISRPVGNTRIRAREGHRRSGKPRSRLIKSLGKDDQMVEYFKPRRKPPWLSDRNGPQLPESINGAGDPSHGATPGFRPITVTIVTTLLDPLKYPADKLIELRLSRWLVEINIRHLKITLGLDVLKGKSLEMVRKERWMFLLVYNLIRVLMLGRPCDNGSTSTA